MNDFIANPSQIDPNDSNSSNKQLAGEERIEHSKFFNRNIRQGNPAALSIADIERVHTALQANNSTEAKDYIDLIHPNYWGITTTFIEWCLALPNITKQVDVNANLSLILKSAEKLWLDEIAVRTEFFQSKKNYKLRTAIGFEYLCNTFSAANLTEHSVVSFRNAIAEKQSHGALDALTPCQEIYDNMCDYLKNDNCKAAKECFAEYVIEIRAIHDLSGIYVSSYSTSLLEHTKQNLTVEIMQSALESCGLLQGMWGLIASLPPIGLALFLAEHLRGHFSGTDRKGAVKILEEADCYKLIFEPCGTGGVLRQVKTKGLGILPESSPYTWGRENEVPVYCSHCAKNELTSFEKLGFLAWVTEFNPDSSMPCGWTVYKDRNKIPKKYYERLQLI